MFKKLVKRTYFQTEGGSCGVLGAKSDFEQEKLIKMSTGEIQLRTL